MTETPIDFEACRLEKRSAKNADHLSVMLAIFLKQRRDSHAFHHLLEKTILTR